MRRIILAFLCFCGPSLAPGAAVLLDATLPAEERRSLQHEALLVIELLQGLHYSDRPFSDLAAPELLDRFLENLDRDHLMLTAPEVTFIHHRFDRDLKPVYLFKGDLHPAFEIYDLFATGALARCAWIDQRLQQPVDLASDATVTVDRRKAAWPGSDEEADALWDRWLRLAILQEMLDGRDQTAAIAEVRRHFAEARRQIADIDPLVVRERFLDTLLEIFDPHSGYFSRDSAQQFDVMMSGAVVGIGVDLRSIHGKFLIEAVQPGGPADRSGRINPGDELIAIAEAGGKPATVAGRRLRELVELVGGESGSKVTLTLRAQANDKPFDVSLDRARVEIARDHVRGAVVAVPAGPTTISVGVLTIPAFYGAGDASVRTASVSADVRELLRQFRSRGVGAVVIDLRNNGGGLIDEAVKLAGLFIRSGPVLLVRGLDSKVEERRDDDPAVAFGGPLAILTNRNSASASEGLAGALQCYHRAVIVGAETTFGKGTAQDFIDLRKLPPAAGVPFRETWGVLRVTRQYYFLPDGSTPQQKGVASGIVLPAYFSSDPLERDLRHALPAEAVAAHAPDDAVLGTSIVTEALLARLREKSSARINDLPEFTLLKRAIELHRRWRTRPEWSLRLDARQRERAADDQTRAALRREHQDLEARLAYPASPVDLAVVVDAERAHQAALRARTLPDGSPCVNHFCWNVFYYEAATGGPIREVRIDALDFDTFAADRAALAGAWTRATKRPMTEAQAAAILADLKHRNENPDDAPDVPAVFRGQMGAEGGDRILIAGREAFLRKAIELDGDVLLERPGLDVSLRESQRIAADWASLQPPTALATSAAPGQDLSAIIPLNRPSPAVAR
jgi:carboxyl-terminal processing protease